jgi:hypothetical protein
MASIARMLPTFPVFVTDDPNFDGSRAPPLINCFDAMWYGNSHSPENLNIKVTKIAECKPSILS